MTNKTDMLNVKDYSIQLEELPSCKLYKLIDVATDNLIDLKQEVKDVEDYLETIKIILNKRGE